MKLFAIVVLGLGIGAARADGLDSSMVSFGGFGTLGVVHSSEGDADFASSVFNPDGAGHSHTWSADVDSLVGAQLTLDFTPAISATIQVISHQDEDDSYAPHLEWANVKYQFTPDFFVRAGRVLMPSFLGSDSRQVGYTGFAVRLPIEVYSLVPITSNDGMDASYRFRSGEITNTVHGTYGVTDIALTDGSDARARHQWGIFNTTEYGDLTIRAAYHQAQLTLDGINKLFDAFRAFGPDGIAIAEKYDCDGEPITFGSLGGRFDPGRWFVVGEWATGDSHCVVGIRTAWYIGSGYRFAEFSPYVIYATTDADSNRSDPGLDLSGLPPFLVGPAAGLNGVLNSILNSLPVQTTLSVGGRWDFMKNAALKLQFDHIRLGRGSHGALINVQPDFEPGGDLNVISATIDFVF